MTEAAVELGWWVLHGQALLDGLRRCHAGEDPEIVYTEMYANSRVEQVDGP